MGLPHIVDSFFGLVEAKDAVLACFGYVDHALILTEGQPCRCAEAAESNRPDALLLHVDNKQTATPV